MEINNMEMMVSMRLNYKKNDETVQPQAVAEALREELQVAILNGDLDSVLRGVACNAELQDYSISVLEVDNDETPEMPGFSFKEAKAK